METRASYTIVGAFVLGLMGALVGIAVWLAGVEFGKAPTQYLIYFSGNVTGLSIGSPVRYRGVPVGSVRDIRIDSENVERVRVLIEVSDKTPIKTDTIAELSFQGITGIAFVQLAGGTQNASLLTAPQKYEVAVIQSRRSLLQEVATRFPQVLQKSVVIADRLTQLFDEKNIQAIAMTLENTRQASQLLGAKDGELTLLLGEGREAIKSVRSAVVDFQNLTLKLNNQIDPLTATAGSTMVDAKKTLADIREAAVKVAKVADSLQSITSGSEEPMREFARSGLYEFSLFLSEARILVDALTRLTNRIERDPAQFFFGDSQRGVKP